MNRCKPTGTRIVLIASWVFSQLPRPMYGRVIRLSFSQALELKDMIPYIKKYFLILENPSLTRLLPSTQFLHRLQTPKVPFHPSAPLPSQCAAAPGVPTWVLGLSQELALLSSPSWAPGSALQPQLGSWLCPLGTPESQGSDLALSAATATRDVLGAPSDPPGFPSPARSDGNVSPCPQGMFCVTAAGWSQGAPGQRRDKTPSTPCALRSEHRRNSRRRKNICYNIRKEALCGRGKYNQPQVQECTWDTAKGHSRKIVKKTVAALLEANIHCKMKNTVKSSEKNFLWSLSLWSFKIK